MKYVLQFQLKKLKILHKYLWARQLDIFRQPRKEPAAHPTDLVLGIRCYQCTGTGVNCGTLGFRCLRCSPSSSDLRHALRTRDWTQHYRRRDRSPARRTVPSRTSRPGQAACEGISASAVLQSVLRWGKLGGRPQHSQVAGEWTKKRAGSKNGRKPCQAKAWQLDSFFFTEKNQTLEKSMPMSRKNCWL